MAAQNTGPKRNRLPTVRVTTVGLALGAGGFAGAADARAEPVPTPLTAPPANDFPAWTSAPTPFAANPKPRDVVPAGGVAPPVMPVMPAVPAPPGDWPKSPTPVPLAPVAPPLPVAPLAQPAEPVEPPLSAPLAPPSQPVSPLPLLGVGSNVSATTVPAAPSAPGDDPMRTRLTGLKAAVAGAALAAAPAPARAEEPKVPLAETTKDEVAKLSEKLAAALKRLGDAEITLAAQKTKIDDQDRVIQKLTLAVDGSAVTEGLTKQIAELKTKFSDLQKDYTILAARMPASGDTSTSGKVPQPMAAPGAPVTPSAPGASPAAPTTPIAGVTGTVMIINQYATPVKLVLNGISHTVEPNSTKAVAVAAPEFVYELMGGAGSTRQPIKPGETLNLTIN